VAGQTTWEIGCDPAWAVETFARSVRTAFAASKDPCAPLPGFEIPRGPEIDAVTRLQPQIPTGTVAELDFACILAYSGVQYRANVERLLRPRVAPVAFEQAAGRGASHNAEHGEPPQAPAHLARLYAKWRDPMVLFGLLDLPLQGSADRMAADHALFALWGRHYKAILHASADPPRRRRRVWRALARARHSMPDPGEWYGCVHRVRWGLACRDRALRSCSIEILSHLLSPRASPRAGPRRFG
jgi:hypothetical protein